MSKTVAIHQPNFFPWLGYFDKIARSDVFIFLDHVQYPKTGGSWSNRVKLLLGEEARWMTAPVERDFHGVRAINEMAFKNDTPWRSNLLKSLVANYVKAPFFRETRELIEPLLLSPENNIAKYNGAAVIAIAKCLELPIEKILWSSDMGVDKQGNEMLIALTRAAGGGAYMCGGGAQGYQDDDAFAAAGVNLIYQDFRHPVYPQVGCKDLVSGLSVIDALMNIGVDEVRAALHAARKP